jgi:hypothetical protein
VLQVQTPGRKQARKVRKGQRELRGAGRPSPVVTGNCKTRGLCPSCGILPACGSRRGGTAPTAAPKGKGSHRPALRAGPACGAGGCSRDAVRGRQGMALTS